jgi:hypothetical protein
MLAPSTVSSAPSATPNKPPAASDAIEPGNNSTVSGVDRDKDERSRGARVGHGASYRAAAGGAKKQHRGASTQEDREQQA